MSNRIAGSIEINSDGSRHPAEHCRGHDHATRLRRLLHALRPHGHDATESIEAVEENSDAGARAANTGVRAADAGVRAAWVGLAGMLVTAGAQLAIVAVSGSIGLLADAVHSFSHAVTTIPLLVAFRLGRRAPTKRYPYGYRRAEDLAGVFITLVIALSAVLIIIESIHAVIDPRELANLGWVLAAALVGVLGNELVAIYRIRVGRRIGSAALVAEGHHARADGLTSLVVVVGVVGVWAGVPQADAIAGFLVAVAIVGILVNSCRTVVRRLMDGVDDGTVESIEAVAASVDGVRDVGRVRARWTGHRLEADIDIAVDASVSLERAACVADDVSDTLRHHVRHLHQVIVHLRPSHDHRYDPQSRVGHG
ncbi:cation transporter [Actinobacteria bacterium YIM 96077]|uniref:Cation transporter n=1 Tax=Phytoactinopolyspora halophila TaxID=1981511 RepID=A0A329QWG0_9ACTN|nr:cation diffusion facilitator family transporter [Phytoactinopolyspora halophila]AYY13814.1 cation transporter [Actinobacteria bacterium YIM 96077]RAW15642.1 cation transporter [Phytoactinopolyspora halophila]